MWAVLPKLCTGHDFYPRPPRGGRRIHRGHAAGKPAISIHALREEGDQGPRQASEHSDTFLSTPSARRATSNGMIGAFPLIDFYPRPPRGGRPNVRFFGMPTENFYPRPPRGGRPKTADF